MSVYLLHSLILVITLVVITYGANLLTTGSVAIAQRFKISPLTIGLTIVAFGTSTPELVVSWASSLSGFPDIALGNVIGSNVANVLLIGGLSALVCPMFVKHSTMYYEIPFMTFISLLLFILLQDQWFGEAIPILGRIDGLILLALFVLFTFYILKLSKEKEPAKTEEGLVSTMGWFRAVFLFLLGLVMLILGGKFFVSSAVTIAQAMGVSEAVIGLTIVAVGTSLPELATSMVAAFRKQSDIAIGNIVGSNIFNILFILGSISVAAPIQALGMKSLDYGMLLFSSVLLFFFSSVLGKSKINRLEGSILLLVYVAYIILVVYTL